MYTSNILYYYSIILRPTIIHNAHFIGELWLEWCVRRWVKGRRALQKLVNMYNHVSILGLNIVHGKSYIPQLLTVITRFTSFLWTLKSTKRHSLLTFAASSNSSMMGSRVNLNLGLTSGVKTINSSFSGGSWMLPVVAIDATSPSCNNCVTTSKLFLL